jgi:hypothetical protein
VGQGVRRGRRGPCGQCDPQQLTRWNIGPVITGLMFHRYDLFSVSTCQIRARPVMTALLAGPLTDPVGLGAVRADLASVVPQVLGPARVWLRISHCDRDWLTRDRRWRERSRTDRGFDRQPAQGPDVFAVGMRHGRNPETPAGSVGEIVVMRIGAVACGDPATGGGW